MVTTCEVNRDLIGAAWLRPTAAGSMEPARIRVHRPLGNLGGHGGGLGGSVRA